MNAPLYGCIEAGGTKFIVGIVGGPDDIRETIRIDTTTPDQTIGATINWLKAAEERYTSLTAIGIASFGPLELDRKANNWGHITATTKHGWSNTDFAARLAREMLARVGFDTDVNGAALAEARWGASLGQKVSVYLTVGTGIGGGAIIDGRVLQGLSHPEMGHIRPQRHSGDLGFAGICPFHGDCLEGLASGPAIKARWGVSLSELPIDHPAHDIIAFYIAQMVVTLQSIMEPGRIILGGGVMGTPGLIERIRQSSDKLGSSYFRGKAQDIIVPPGLGERAGLLGALALAQDIASA
jgi:fructokinase